MMTAPGLSLGTQAAAGSRLGDGREEGDWRTVLQRLMTRLYLWWALCSTETWAASWPCRGGHHGVSEGWGLRGKGQAWKRWGAGYGGTGYRGVVGIQGRGPEVGLGLREGGSRIP